MYMRAFDARRTRLADTRIIDLQISVWFARKHHGTGREFIEVPLDTFGIEQLRSCNAGIVQREAHRCNAGNFRPQQIVTQRAQ